MAGQVRRSTRVSWLRCEPKLPSSAKVYKLTFVQSMIPSTKPEMVIHYDDPVCCGQFSDDGNFFYACVKVSKYSNHSQNAISNTV
jgi:hypothetical protein